MLEIRKKLLSKIFIKKNEIVKINKKKSAVTSKIIFHLTCNGLHASKRIPFYVTYERFRKICASTDRLDNICFQYDIVFINLYTV